MILYIPRIANRHYTVVLVVEDVTREHRQQKLTQTITVSTISSKSKTFTKLSSLCKLKPEMEQKTTPKSSNHCLNVKQKVQRLKIYNEKSEPL